MPTPFFQSVLIVAVVSVCTFLTRALAFLLFGGDRPMPASIEYLGKVLPSCIIAILVVYCLKGIQLTNFPHGAPELISVAVVVLLHRWKRNNLMSIGAGTALYMLLIQTVFTS